MIPEIRASYNARFTVEKYERLVRSLIEATATQIEFRLCETPVFLPPSLLATMQQAADEIIAQLCEDSYHQASKRAIPPAYDAPGEGVHPDFVQVDFAITRDQNGELVPKLIELQGCASLYGFQFILPEHYKRIFELEGFGALLGGLNEESYLSLLREILLAEHDPESVVLMEIDPLRQKTLPDFRVTEKLLGLPFICVTEVIKRGRNLFYIRDGREIEIRRIYNRVIIDEFIRREVRAQFDFRDELDVEWVGHPNWYFRMSKFSLPWLDHPTVPRAYFLDQLRDYPDDLENFVLKPLFSFAGSGVKIDITRADLDAVPDGQRADYLLQEKVVYAPIIETMDEPSKVEVRLMYLWPQGAPEPIPAATLTRLSKGVMMGVDFNRNKTWVGSSCGLFPV